MYAMASIGIARPDQDGLPEDQSAVALVTDREQWYTKDASTTSPPHVSSINKPYALNKQKAMRKKLDQTDRPTYKVLYKKSKHPTDTG